MRRKKKDKNNINNQEEIDLIPIESQQEETEVGTQPDAEPENPEATAEDTSDASLETETEVESIKTEAESAEPESPEVAAEDTSAQPETPEEESESSALFGAYVAEENKWERKNRIKDEKIKAKQEKKRAKYADVDDDTYEQMKAGGAHKFFWCAVFDDADCRNCRSCTVCLPFGHCTFLRAGGREGKEPACRRICHGDRYFQI